MKSVKKQVSDQVGVQVWDQVTAQDGKVD